MSKLPVRTHGTFATGAAAPASTMPSSRNFFSTFPAIHILQAAVRPLHGPQHIIGDRTAAHRGPNGGCGCRLRKRTLFLPPSGGQGVSSEDCRTGGKIGLEQ